MAAQEWGTRAAHMKPWMWAWTAHVHQRRWQSTQSAILKDTDLRSSSTIKFSGVLSYPCQDLGTIKWAFKSVGLLYKATYLFTFTAYACIHAGVGACMYIYTSVEAWGHTHEGCSPPLIQGLSLAWSSPLGPGIKYSNSLYYYSENIIWACYRKLPSCPPE